MVGYGGSISYFNTFVASAFRSPSLTLLDEEEE
jgi:hypothetical protein